MKTIPAILLLLILLTNTVLTAQEKEKKEKITFSYEFRESKSKTDSIPDLYCKLRLPDIASYQQITIQYNDKSRNFLIKDLKKGQHKHYEKQSEYLYIKVDELLDEPFVIVTATDKKGNTHTIYSKSSTGEVSDPSLKKGSWKQERARVDSLNYLSQYKWFKGKDGKPRYYNKKEGKVYLINKDGLEEEVLEEKFIKPAKQVNQKQGH